MSHRVFVSYSHHDAALIARFVKLMRTTNDWVFLDSDSIKTGKQWRREVDTALSSATLIVVFWCRHSQGSTEVRREYRAALSTKKEVLPVLLDSTLPPRVLARFQWLDFRGFVLHDDDDIEGGSGGSSQTLNASLFLPILIAGIAWLAQSGMSLVQFGVTILLSAVALAVALIARRILLWVESRLSASRRKRWREFNFAPGSVRRLEAEIRRRLEPAGNQEASPPLAT
jgi:hypothetical protein